MLCPVCKTTRLTMADRNGIEIDYCPDCRGIWLDRGELDKLIEKTSQSHQYTQSQYQGGHQQGSHQHKRESWIGELFDFG